ncbi:P-loop containing nucleoside triphosphate hydrolase protein [Cylindrobasidium torrendii FP15055 ss-10]|uniref:p-loop containing nucleoside triphosphate hydrolase protein n=1 Tax=Cylindrobasidium torrendii FP15055 ss-10 TaxID=1314674 RepID=A0A0D7BUB5_9AGAR|nr:P-loop containing nucleoside triphosphate hydrolase protein [Cylindrobasidium torrendii FP15055 ss-10]
MATTSQEIIASLSKPKDIRNMALVAHIDSGKTTLTESILLKSHYLSSSGSVDMGSTTTDFLPAERERGITIQSASIPVRWKNWTFNLIDTPGHADFGMEVESASRVVDGAVVLMDSVEGVEAQTKRVWRQLDKYGVRTRMVFLNKLDRPGASFSDSLASILAHKLHRHPTPLALPVASFDEAHYQLAEPGVEGIVDLVTWELYKFSPNGPPSKAPLPRTAEAMETFGLLSPTHPVTQQLIPARMALIDTLSTLYEPLLEKVLSLPDDPWAYASLTKADIMPYLRQATISNDILPILCGSALKHVGTDMVMDYIGELFASPVDVLPKALPAKAPTQLLAWKVGWDKKKKQWYTFVRVYSGTVKRQTVLMNQNRHERERLSKLQLYFANEAQDVEELPFGSVGVIQGLRFTRTGDTLISNNLKETDASALPAISTPPSVISVSVIPQSHADLEPVMQALESLSRTDPSVRVDMQEGQLLVHGMGALHLEIVEGRLRDEFGARFEIGERRVSYREGLGSNHASVATDNTVTIAGSEVQVSFKLRPLEEHEIGDFQWDGNVVVGKDGKAIPYPQSSRETEENCIAAGLASALSSSPHSGLPLSHVHVQVLDYASPSVGLLNGASAKAVQTQLRAAGMGPIMEPYFAFKISVSEDSMGKVAKDLTEHGAELMDMGSDMEEGDEALGFSREGVYIPPAILSPSASNVLKKAHSVTKRHINAFAPLSRMLDYNNRLRAISGGHGQFEMANAGFREVSGTRQKEILREIGRA